jgi:hypothetical protein
VFGTASYVVSASATLSGYTSTTFMGEAQNAFAGGMSSLLGVAPSAVVVTGVADAPGRRRLAAGSVAVQFSVFTSSASAANGLASSITAASPEAFVAALQSSGLTACTGIAVSAPVVEAPTVAPVNVSDIADISVVTDAVTAQFANLSAADAIAQQDVFLTSLSSSSDGANLSSSAAENTASLVLAVVNAAPGVVLSPESQSAALNILASVANAPINVTGGAAQSVTAALSTVALSASASNPAALILVQNVLTSLASSQSSSLAAELSALPPGAPPPDAAVTSSPTIQTLVQIDPPGSSRLTSMPLTAPGSPSSFEPMPAGLLDPNAAVVTQFFSLAFDPNGGANTTGVTRLAFSNPDGSPIPVEDALTPIRFSLPRVDTSGDAQAVCSFWDTSAGAYATHGCVGVPSPGPPEHSLFFVDGFTAANDTALALAWNISGPLLDGCRVALLDCNEPAPGVIYPDNRNPLTVPAIACPPRANAANGTASAPNATAPREPVLRVYYGTRCALWQPDNAYNCSWDAIKQSFVGGGCVSADGPTQCMCRQCVPRRARRSSCSARLASADARAPAPLSQA